MKKTILFAWVLMMTACANVPKYSWEEDFANRQRLAFNWTADDVKEYVRQYIPEVTDEQVAGWTESGLLESMELDGKRMYFNRTASNLFRKDAYCKARKKAVTDKDNDSAHGTSIDAGQDQTDRDNLFMLSSPERLALPTRTRVHITLTVKADVVPDGEVIRCWLPYPRRDVPRQKDVVLLDANRDYVISDPDAPRSSLYMEAKAVKGEPTLFEETVEYTSYAEYRPLNVADIQPYDTTSELWRTHTAEREKHVVFTPQMRHLSDSLTAGLTNPYDKVKAIYGWITQFPWCGAMDYSIIDNIPEYVWQHQHGDCGEVTLLMMTLCRIAGIPCRFQSGLTTEPEGWNMHDWAEIYYEGIGWVPVDQSAGRHYADNEAMRWYYVTAADRYRMTVNNDFCAPYQPAKQYPASDIVDFQRGDVEWRGGNIYNVGQWSFDMEVTYPE